MEKIFCAILSACIALSTSANSEEIKEGKNGSLLLENKIKNKITIYNDITRSKDGVYRSLIKTNGATALFTSGAADIIYTLTTQNGKIYIDCAIAETRSNETGISIRKRICGIEKELSADYADLGYSFTDQWKQEASTINITSLIKGEPLDIKTANIKGIEVHEYYSSMESLESSNPLYYLKNSNNCHSLPHKKIYIEYLVNNSSTPIGLSILAEPEKYNFKRLKPDDLNSLKYRKCNHK